MKKKEIKCSKCGSTDFKSELMCYDEYHSEDGVLKHTMAVYPFESFKVFCDNCGEELIDGYKLVDYGFGENEEDDIEDDE